MIIRKNNSSNKGSRNKCNRGNNKVKFSSSSNSKTNNKYLIKKKCNNNKLTKINREL